MQDRHVLLNIIAQGKDTIQNVSNFWSSNPIWLNALTAIITYCTALFADVFIFIFSILILSFLDTHWGIKASKIQGIEYDSKKRRKGLIDKSMIFMTAFILSLLLDLMAHKFYDYNNAFITFFILFALGVYESTSIVEKLLIVYPENQFIIFLSRVFMLFRKSLNKKVEQLTDEKIEK